MSASTRERILTSARRAFSIKGLARATIRNIVNDADANIASINYHFGSRENLIRELFHETMAFLQKERDEELEKILCNLDDGSLSPENIIDAKYWPLFRRFQCKNPKDVWRNLSIVFQVRQDPSPECIKIVSHHDAITDEVYNKKLAHALRLSLKQARMRMGLVNAAAWDTVSNIQFAKSLSQHPNIIAELKMRYSVFRAFSSAGLRYDRL